MAKFWESGLRFECHQCGNCCTFQGGVVHASKEEFETIARFLNTSKNKFYENYTSLIDGKVSIKSFENGHCYFYDGTCRIYPVRPNQCKTYPFWSTILKNKKRWTNEKAVCKGIDKGNIVPVSEIREKLSIDRKTTTL